MADLLTNTFGFDPNIPPDIYAQAEALKRRQAIAQQLLAQSQEPIQEPVIKGRFQGRVSPLQGIAKIAQAYMGAKQMEGADKERGELAGKYQKGVADAYMEYLKMKQGGVENNPDMAIKGMTGSLDEQDVPRETTVRQVDPRAAVQAALMNPYLKNHPGVMMDIQQMGRAPEKVDAGTHWEFWRDGVKIGQTPKYSTPDANLRQDREDARYRNVSGNTAATIGSTNQRDAENRAQRERHWIELSPPERAKLEMEAARLGISAKELFFNTGQQAPPIPAVPPAAAPMTQTPQPPMMPPPNATPPIVPQAARPAPIVAPGAPATLPATVPKGNVLQTELAREQQLLSQATDPQRQQLHQRNIEMLTKEIAGQAGIVGTPMPRGAEALAAPAAPVAAPPALPPKAQVAIATKREQDRPQETFAARSTLDGLNRVDTLLQKLETHPGVTWVTGPVAGRLPSVDDKSVDAQALIDTLKQQISVQELQRMRDASKTGGAVGNVTENEWPRLEAQLGALQQSQTTGAFKANIAEVRKSIERMNKNVRDAYKDAYGELDWKPPNAGAIRGATPPLPPGFRLNN